MVRVSLEGLVKVSPFFPRAVPDLFPKYTAQKPPKGTLITHPRSE